jgi:L-ascorbate metabolism protein UlaG (beta-lactamase superfamily)
VLLEHGGVRLLTDPVLRRRVVHLRRHPPLPEDSLNPQAVLLSHLHFDHLDLPSLRAMGAGVRILAPRGAGDFLRGAGLEAVEELAPGDRTQVGDVAVTATPAEHDGGRRPLGPRVQPLGFVTEAERSVYFAGDTDLFAEMDEMAGTIDVALLPVWGWGTTLKAGHLDPRRAAEAAARIRPRIAVPIHWGTLFPIGRARKHGHLLHDPPREFAAQVAELAPDVEVRVLEPGESLALTS